MHISAPAEGKEPIQENNFVLQGERSGKHHNGKEKKGTENSWNEKVD